MATRIMTAVSKVLSPPGVPTLGVSVVAGVVSALVSLWVRGYSEEAVDASTATGIVVVLATSVFLWLWGLVVRHVRLPLKSPSTKEMPEEMYIKMPARRHASDMLLLWAVVTVLDRWLLRVVAGIIVLAGTVFAVALLTTGWGIWALGVIIVAGVVLTAAVLTGVAEARTRR